MASGQSLTRRAGRIRGGGPRRPRERLPAHAPRRRPSSVGPEFTSRALDQWAYANGVTLKLIQAGKPTQNAYIESFNGKFRDECLNEHWFTTLAHARAVIAAWRQDYNEQRPHSALNYLAPSEFAAKHRATADAPAAFQELV
ncbi:integrase core domain protein [Burkholderia mallei]|nr:integrase core domain protein [Burkholderia mallei]